MKVSVLKPSTTLFEGEAKMVVVPSVSGEIGIMDNHENMLLALKKGVVKIEDTIGTPKETFDIEDGFVVVDSGEVSILV